MTDEPTQEQKKAAAKRMHGIASQAIKIQDYLVTIASSKHAPDRGVAAFANTIIKALFLPAEHPSAAFSVKVMELGARGVLGEDPGTIEAETAAALSDHAAAMLSMGMCACPDCKAMIEMAKNPCASSQTVTSPEAPGCDVSRN